MLATYNGARFLPEQLQSLSHQDHPDWSLLALDDASNDGSRAILEAFANKHPERVHLLPTTTANRGAVGAFAALLADAVSRYPETRYFAFCDQDDWWYANKLRVMLHMLQATEADAPDRPTLVHCDLAVVAEDLSPRQPSFWALLGVAPDENRLDRLILKNTVTGCATLFNRALAELAVPIPPGTIMHDWWLALVAAATGIIATVPIPLIKYRQHGCNALGAARHARTGQFRRLLSPTHWQHHVLDFHTCPERRIYAQADLLAKRYAAKLQPADAVRLGGLAGFADCPKWRRILMILRSGIYPRRPARFMSTLLKV